jgi:hypothetical protein
LKIKSIAPWFGGKRTMADEIVTQLGPHASYWEPFCGSMAVLLAKPESQHEHVNDLHGDLINLFGSYRGKRGVTSFRHPVAGDPSMQRVVGEGQTLVAGSWDEQAALGIGVVPGTARSRSIRRRRCRSAWSSSCSSKSAEAGCGRSSPRATARRSTSRA